MDRRPQEATQRIHEEIEWEEKKLKNHQAS